MRFESTLLAILDISGYTTFIRQRATTLVHAEEIITELLEATLDGAEVPLRLNKLEGDAALLWVEPGDDPGARARAVLARIDAAFAAFDARRQAITSLRSHCQCGACANIGALSLKALLHVGEVAHKVVRGLNELAGEPVILIHRLLKNGVGVPRYVLMTDDFRDLLGAGAPPLQATTEQPDGYQPLRVWVALPPQAAGVNVIATPFMQ
jgi:hypothetical protein